MNVQINQILSIPATTILNALLPTNLNTHIHIMTNTKPTTKMINGDHMLSNGITYAIGKYYKEPHNYGERNKNSPTQRPRNWTTTSH